jgi:hypothetical protein
VKEVKKNLTAIYDLAVATIEIQLQKHLLMTKQERFVGQISNAVEYFTEELNNLSIIKNQNRLLAGFDYQSIFRTFLKSLEERIKYSSNFTDGDDCNRLLQMTLEIVYDAENDMTIWFRENEDTIAYLPIEESMTS